MKVRMNKIETISYFDKDKYPMPIRFRIEGREGEKYVVHIDRVSHVTKDRRAGNEILIYDCQAQIRDKVVLLQLVYDIGTYTWYLFKI